jgi:hypothetical protein
MPHTENQANYRYPRCPHESTCQTTRLLSTLAFGDPMTKQPSIAENACAHCNWPENEHHENTGWCPDYGFQNSATGWLQTRYRRKQLVLTESVMTHMLTDIDQIVTEMEIGFSQRHSSDWIAMLRAAVDGEDYKR